MDNKKQSVVIRLIKLVSMVETKEIRSVLLSFSLIFVLMSSYYILRPIRDSMSSDWTDAQLSLLYTATFAFSAIAVILYGAACSRIRMKRVVPGVYCLFVLSFLSFYVFIRLSPDTVFANKAFFVWTSVFSLFHVSVFWSLMADIFSKQQAKRLFAFIAAGGSAGAIIGPAISLGLVHVVGRDTLILISAFMLVVPVVLVGMLNKLKHGDLYKVVPVEQEDYKGFLGSNPFAGFSLFFTKPYLLGIGLFILLYTSISIIVYFELKNLMIGVDENVRVQIWAGMDLIVNVMAIGAAMFITSRLATRFGLAIILPMIPMLIALGLLVVSLVPMLWVVVVLQIVRRGGNYAITRPAREMLYTVVDRESRFKAKSVIDIVVYRGGDVAAAWIFTILSQGLGLDLSAIAAIGACVACVWVLLGINLGRAFDRHDVAVQSMTMQAGLVFEKPL